MGGKEFSAMKKILAVIVSAAMAVCFLAGCSEDKNTEFSEKDKTSEVESLNTTTEKTTSALKTTSSTTRKVTSSTPIPTQATIRTVSQSPTMPTTTTTTTTSATTTSTTETTQPATDQTEFTMTEGAYSVTLNGNKVAVGMDITDKISQLGNPEATVSHDGDLSIYSYSGCKITARSGYVIQITVTDDSISTEAGVKIGSSRSEVAEKYPSGSSSDASIYVTSGESAVRFNISDDKVSLITISVS